jgi:hypothetical protein
MQEAAGNIPKESIFILWLGKTHIGSGKEMLLGKPIMKGTRISVEVEYKI